MRADFVAKQLPPEVDTLRHGGLLATLHVNVEELTAAAAAAETSTGDAPGKE
jgi:hypothetical protein